MEGLENQSLGKYDIIRQMGIGNMGTVYLGMDTFAGRNVPIKVANPDSSKPEKLTRRHRKLFFNEAKASGLLRHPNIVTVHDASVEGDIHYIVMEYYIPDHSTLAKYCLPENLMSLKHVVKVMLKCAIAFDYAHRKGVIHRDIKPKNILLTQEQEVSFYILLAASVVIRRRGKDIDRLKAGSCFGEIGSGSKHGRSASVYSSGESTVMKVRASLIQRTSSNCQIQIHRSLLSSMADRLSRATDPIADWDVG